MRLHSFLLTLLILTAHFVKGQSSSVTIVETLDKGDYNLIPATALEFDVDAVLYQEKTTKKVNNGPIMLHWQSICNDATYYLTITPEQIYFTSTQENTNRIFWLIGISQSQYMQIKKGLSGKTPKGFENQTKNFRGYQLVFYDEAFTDKFSMPDEWTEATSAQFEAYCKLQRKVQLTKFFSVLNACIAETKYKIQVPAEKELTTADHKFFGASREELLEWLSKN